MSNNTLCITNTYMYYNYGRDQHKVSWHHPRSKQWYQIDFVIVRRNDINATKQTRSFHSTDCNTDHLLIIANLKTKILTKNIQTSQRPRKPKINAKNTKNPDLRVKFQKYQYFKEQLQDVDESSPDNIWNSMKTAIYDSASKAFGTNRVSKVDWIEAHASTLMSLLEKKRRIVMEHNRNPTKSTKQQLRATNKIKPSKRNQNKH